MFRAVSYHRRLVLIIVAVGIASTVGYYLASPLFISQSVSENPPGANSQVLVVGTFAGADSFHRASGTAKIIQLDNGSRILRLESFSATNGPDLYVYLSADQQAQDYVSLGRLKGNIGDQNYDLAVSADLSRYKYVLIWCQAFRVLFGSALLA